MSSSIQFIRNATLVLNYANQKLLIDPMFAEKGRYPGFPQTKNAEVRNPMVEMPVSPESLINVDAVLLSHLHPDHWDEVAIKILPKDMPVFAQNEEDKKTIQSQGFQNVSVMEKENTLGPLNFTLTHCQHGTDEAYAIPEVANILGKSSGFYCKADFEKSVYFIGDTIWIEEVENNLQKWKPDVVVVNAGYASMQDDRLGAIIMGQEDILKIHELLPEAMIIAIHMEAINHCILSRKALREFVIANGISNHVLIPEDGEIIEI